jgi:uncharacterized membrane protein
MNILQTFLVIGLFGLFLVFAIAPITNVASNAVDNANSFSGFPGLFFGNLTFFILLIFVVSILMMMWTG